MNKYIRVICDELFSIVLFFLAIFPGRLGFHLRGYIVGFFCKKAGRHITVKQNVEIYQPWNLQIGDGSGFGRNNIIDCTGGVSVGCGTRFGPFVVIASMNHAPVGGSIRGAKKKKSPVSIGDYCWIGANVVILPGVTIGDHCIIAAGSVVTKDVPSSQTVAGVPARQISKQK